MERGPMALFGAIVAIGLGPAMWAGAQFGSMGDAHTKPPAITSEQQPGSGQTADNGGAAGAAPDDPSIVLDTRPRANYKPLRPDPSADPSRSASTEPDPDAPSTGPTSTKSTPSDKPTTPPTESTTEPTDPATGGGGGGENGGGGGGVQPSPPATDPGAAQKADTPTI
jgi:hypothetical protein